MGAPEQFSFKHWSEEEVFYANFREETNDYGITWEGNDRGPVFYPKEAVDHLVDLGKWVIQISREDKIKFCRESAEEFGIEPLPFEGLTNEQLDKQVEWFDYLWEK